jgi:hypothetical protein
VITVKRGWLLSGAAVVLGVAVLAPLAFGAERPDDRADRTSVGTLVGGADRYLPIGTADTVEARLRAGFDARGSAVVPPRPDDRAGTIGVGSVEPSMSTVSYATAETHWTDPLTVGLIAGVVALAGVVMVYGVVHRRRGGGTHGTPRAPTVAH